MLAYFHSRVFVMTSSQGSVQCFLNLLTWIMEYSSIALLIAGSDGVAGYMDRGGAVAGHETWHLIQGQSSHRFPVQKAYTQLYFRF
jgi:hypothetical protein